ncbi:uncharacterized protein LOC144656129 [Oculina patagonica]
MKISGLLAFLAVAACFVCSCKGTKYSLLQPHVLKNMNRVLVSERMVFIQDFQKFCRSYQKERWLNLTEVVCFGSRGNKFAAVGIPMEGFLMSIKLVHVTGHASCDSSSPQYNEKWGCSRSHPVHGGMPFNVVITTGKNNGILYPKELSLKSKKESLWYDIPEVEPDSPELIFGDSSYPHYVTSGQELRVWFGDDLVSSGGKNNKGKVCITVQGWYMH